MDAQSGILYVANRQGNCVTLVSTGDLTIIDTVPLALTLADMAVDSSDGRLYATASSSDRILVFEGDSLLDTWYVGRYPHHVRLVPGEGWVAVLTQADARLTLLDRRGRVIRTYETGAHPQGLMVQTSAQRIYAGDTVIDLTRQTTRTLRIPTIYHSEAPPVQVVEDTRRKRLYAVAFNGVPGSNGGYVVALLDPRDDNHTGPLPGRLSVIDLIYDKEADRFYSTYARMGSYGLQVSNAEDGRELLHIGLDRYPLAMILNPETRHLWLALPANPYERKEQDTRILAYDTRTMRQAAEMEVAGVVTAMAVDQRQNRVYLANGDKGLIHIIQDLFMPLSPKVKALPTHTPWPTMPPPSPIPTCVVSVDPRMRPAWESSGGMFGLGCAYGGAEEGDWATQPFEHGRMYWRGTTGTILALFEDGSYLTAHDDWREGMPSPSCQANSPAGLRQPIRGFGLVWCREGGIRKTFGWATEQERGFRGAYQIFAHGALLLEPEGTTLLLQSDGHWRLLPP